MSSYAFQTAANYGNLPGTAWSPQIYSKKVQKAFRKKTVVDQITNSDYFGEIKNQGDSVRIIKEPEITVTPYARGSQLVAQDLQDEDFILKSPVRRIHKVKTASTIKETYTDEALETMRDNCETLRDLALIDLLASTGMRVGELVLLNREDINFEERECVVFGKGSKERMVYFDARTKIHLQNYLEEREDGNHALFVSLKAPYERLKIGGVESRLRELGRRLELPRVHPHKFRRTLATVAIDKGMPVEQLQRLLGHQRIDTTLQYAMVKQSNVKLAHRKFLG